MSNKRSAQECVQAFCKLMNRKAALLGMNDSVFNDPAGIHNFSTAKDVLCCLLKVNENIILSGIWSKERNVVFIEGENARQMSIDSKTLIGQGSNCLRGYYKVCGGKGGTLNGPKIYNTAVIVDGPVDNYQVACVVMGAQEPNDKPNNRFAAAKAAIDIALGIADRDAFLCAKSAVVCITNKDKANIVYEKNSDQVMMPASMTKMLTCLIALEIVDDIDAKITVNQEDIDLVPSRFYQNDFKSGDIVTLKDLMAAMLLPSSNSAAYIVGRYIGQMI